MFRCFEDATSSLMKATNMLNIKTCFPENWGLITRIHIHYCHHGNNYNEKNSWIFARTVLSSTGLCILEVKYTCFGIKNC